MFVGKVGKVTLSVKGKAYEQNSLDTKTGEANIESGTLELSGSKLTFVAACPEAQKTFESYTATATTLVVGLGFADGADADKGVLITYTKK
jgi:hypothetical protein